MNDIQKGDFVYYEYDTKEIFPGRVVDIDKKRGKFIVEICTNKKKSMKNELETVECSRSQLRLRKMKL